jgi:hypothetical protein
MGIFDVFRKEEVVGSKVLVCQFGNRFDEQIKSDLRVYQRFYPTVVNLTFASIADLKAALSQKNDILHLCCDVDSAGNVIDGAGGRMPGNDLLRAAVDSGVKLLWLASDNLEDSYNAGFKLKGSKINAVLTLRRLGSNTSLFLDNLLAKMKAGDTFSRAWTVASQPEGKSVQPDVPHTISSAGRGGVVLK